ncbi:MAG: tyrosine-type recombinase/integrase [Candidatus Bathyarchaeota archaeon]|nr:tyrosine-type recombinase/integrase [Candidatus Bathyarchaeota archaeon]
MSNARTPKTLTTEEQEALLEALKKDHSKGKLFCKGLRNYLIAVLMLDAGLRVGEVVQLQLSHLWFETNPVKSLYLTSDMTKNHKGRSVPIGGRLFLAIDNFFTHMPFKLDHGPTYRVFNAPQSNSCLTTRQVENIINAAGYKALGRPVNPHMLRHTFASKLMRVTNIRTVQQLLGHNCISSTQIYTHPNADDMKKAIEEMDGNS